jgi:EAL domain-containing protein (putative c-di-GMP-specific phosphodiesterase class I)
LRTACEQASAWRREYGFQPRVAVNLSIRQFYQKDLLRTIEEALADAGLAPDALELEITESIAMSGIDVVERLLAGIRALGVELAIDDFGTGYSSLAYLKRFPVQCLKVDRAFVHDLGRDADSAAIVRAIVALGHGLKMRIVAEGVETEIQLAMLRELGCDEAARAICLRARSTRRRCRRCCSGGFRQRFQRGARGVAEALERGRLHGGPAPASRRGRRGARACRAARGGPG